MQTAQTILPNPPIAAFRDNLLNAIPKLRAFAVALGGNSDRGDDLVQETLLKALAHADSFQPGSNMMAWLYTILRNQFYSEYRKRRHEAEDAEDRHAEQVAVFPSQEGRVHFLEVREALNHLTTVHREALMLIVSGASYEDAATLCGCAEGTIKSRVNRARARLTELLDNRRTDAVNSRPEFAVSLGGASVLAQSQAQPRLPSAAGIEQSADF